MTDEISLQSSSHRSIVHIAGELDLVTAPLLRAVLKSADDDPTHEFVVALPGITFMDCAGLAPLLEAHSRLGGRLRLRDLPGAVSDVLRLTGLDGRFFIDEETPPVYAGASGARADDPTGPLDHRSRTFTDATPMDDGILVHAETDESTLGVLPVRPGAAIDHRIVIEQAVGLLMASLEGRFFIDEATPPVRAGATGASADDPTGPLGHPSRTLTDATRVGGGPLVHAEDSDTVLGLVPALTADPGAAIDNRIVIEQAVGLLMASLGCDARQASHALFQISWDREVPLHDVAVALVAGAQSPTTVVNDTKLAATVSGGSSRREKRRLPFRD